MKTLRIYTIGLLFIILFSVQNTGLLAQNAKLAIDEKEIMNSNKKYQQVHQYFQEVILGEKINYRKRLRESRKSGRVFQLPGGTYSETEILKHLKRAASKSGNKEEFLQYFLDRDLEFIRSFEEPIITEIYHKIRPKTFNGYIEELEYSFSSI